MDNDSDVKETLELAHLQVPTGKNVRCESLQGVGYVLELPDHSGDNRSQCRGLQGLLWRSLGCEGFGVHPLNGRVIILAASGSLAAFSDKATLHL